MKEKSSVYKAEGNLPGETLERFKIILDKDWVNSPDYIPFSSEILIRLYEVTKPKLKEGRPIIYSTAGDMQGKNMWHLMWERMVDDNISRTNSKDSRKDRAAREFSYPLHPSQVFLVKGKTKFSRACSYIRSILGNIFHTRKKSI